MFSLKHIIKDLFFTMYCIVMFLLIPLLAHETNDTTAVNVDSTEAKESVLEQTRSSRKIEGLFTFFQDTIDGSVQMLIEKNQLNKEYIHFVHSLDGVVDVGHFRGAYKTSKIFEIKKYFNRLEFVSINTSYYFDPENPLSRAKSANINDAVLATLAILATDDETGAMLLNVDDMFLSESLYQIKPTPNPSAKPGTRFTLGSLNKNKCQYIALNNYPLNSDVVIKYVYDNPAPMNRGGPGITDPRAVHIVIQHSFIAVPENDYNPRYDDPRVGYFMTQVTDLTSTSNTPYRDRIHRWNLIKKTPSAPISEPIEPIVFWIENTTPTEFRPAVKEGVLRWNRAYRAAGFKNAIQVKIQPDDAEWDAGDIRYNVLRWTSSPRPPFGGYGPSFVNPRSGQILGADIMLEFVYFTNRVKYEKLYEEVYKKQDLTDHCFAGEYLYQANQFGFTSATISGYNEEVKKRIVHESLIRLVLHEVGHTLGLNHNFKSSYLHNNKTVHNKGITEEMGLTGSVMEYPGINIAPPGIEQGEYYTTTPGPYDIWAIEFGYSTALENNELEESRLNTILSRSTSPSLAFGNDADDMRAPGKGIDPQAMIYDMSSDPISYASDRVELSKYLLDDIVVKYSDRGASYQALRDAFAILLREHSTACGVISRHIGGVYVDRAYVGQRDSNTPFRAVPYNEQKRAINALDAYLFSPTAFNFPQSILMRLQSQRRGFNHKSQTEDPKIHDQVIGMQKNVLNQLLHQNVLKRLTDSGLYGNKYSLDEFMYDLTSSIYKADMRGDVNTFRQNLQTEYAQRLIDVLKPEKTNTYGHHAQAAAFKNLKDIKNFVRKQTGVSLATKTHRMYIDLLVDRALDSK
jgi:hypothetical protein